MLSSFHRFLLSGLIGLAALAALPGPAAGQSSGSGRPAKPDPGTPTLYVVGYAHLDTQWRWDYATTIREYLPKTMRANFDLFEKYPHYVFNFSGANRYRMMKEYYPEAYEKVRQYVAAGRWHPAGSSMEENDVNSPSAESTIRQILYGARWFRAEFGRTSAEYMLPDCFGFPASLPSILAHCGILGFSTQKLSWGSFAPVGGPDSPEKTPAGIPFNLGVWEGLDGRSVVAALNAGDYTGSVTYDLTKTPPPPAPARDGRPQARPLTDWTARLALDGAASGLFADYLYYGTGDTGGSPNEPSVRLMEAIVTRGRAVLEPGAAAVKVGDGPVRVLSTASDQLFRDISPEVRARLPRYKGDLELTNHSAGSITSQAYMKRWNRRNEVLADDAERASVAADWLGGRAYPRRRLADAWTLVMGGQFHDIIPGTSIPKAYEYSWNDEVLALNQFGGVLTSAVGAVAAALDTRVQGTAVIVTNGLSIPRQDVVEAAADFPGGAPQAVRVFGPDGRETPAQLAGGKVVFVADVPPVGFAVYDVRPAGAPMASELKVSTSSLENSRYRVALNADGDVASIFDKAVGRELLAAPARLEIKTDKPAQWPAWNMDWADQSRAPRAYVGGPARVRVVEEGPARVAVEVRREAEGSVFVQTVRLAAGGASGRVEFATVVDWKTPAAHLKAVFPLAAKNRVATYNWEIGTIERPTNSEKQFEMPSHQWVDLTDASGAFGAAILTGAKFGSDKPDDHTLRLTLVRTPGIEGRRGYVDQTSQDWGRHEFVYGIAGHAGDFRRGGADWQGLRLDQPPAAFLSAAHAGALGKSFSLMSVSNGRVRALALKKAEQGDEIVVRLVEMSGRPAKGVKVSFPAPLLAAREVNGVEDEVGPARLAGGALVADFGPFQVRSFAVKMGPAPARLAAPKFETVPLDYDVYASTRDGRVPTGGFDGEGRSLPAEMLPARIEYNGVEFALGPAGRRNAAAARGQVLALPAGTKGRVYILAASAAGDLKARFKIGDKPIELTVQDWGGYIGQWDNRVWTTRQEIAPARPGEPAGTPRLRTIEEYAGLVPGFVKPAAVAWFASHRHLQDGTNDPYAYSYLFAYAIDAPDGAATLTLPDDERIRVLAVTVSDEGPAVRPAAPLFDTLER
ncbi:MAG TPA: glycoside hydrolase family 38 C-terminal domain-containing protein [Candidatus Aminicenantes bacterium]|nr:glycoside hydrolase family 38 C-terminal domain-containing protein [Candidatus Aminicenantes bacterium]HRY64380.1 glycoside hydrolase family 38 C-terminal domain-containing protein [Candidatus Aminicenantes bacterium]HRZ71293.1 glycoside hydrolase family 38 C-terminal domain-containing protein [Candidatus Aminicenantes bacterium]